MNAISETDFGKLVDSDLNSQHLVDYALRRMSKACGGVQPQAAGNDLAHLGAVLSIARPTWRYQVDPHAVGDARKVLRKLGYKMKSRERDRRPSLDELGNIFSYCEEM